MRYLCPLNWGQSKLNINKMYRQDDGAYRVYKKGVHSEDKTRQLLGSFQGSEEFIRGVEALYNALQDSRCLPSGHQLGDYVDVCLGMAGTVRECKVIKVHFSESKVLYDVEVPIKLVDGSAIRGGQVKDLGTTRLYNIDSAMVTKYEGLITEVLDEAI